jgi:hypothetical protein
MKIHIKVHLVGTLIECRMATYLPNEGHWNTDRVRYGLIDCLDCVGHLILWTEHRILETDSVSV